MSTSAATPDVSQVICYLRPVNEASRLALEHPANEAFRATVPFKFKRKGSSSSHDVLRLAFDNSPEETELGFILGSSEAATIQLETAVGQAQDLFRIHYRFPTGALMISAATLLTMSQRELDVGERLLLLPDHRIECQPYDFIVEFPILDEAQLAEHKKRYDEHAKRAGWTDSPFCTTSKADCKSIGEGYSQIRSLGCGAFGEVFEAFDPEGQRVAIKKIFSSMIGEQALNELKFLREIPENDFLIKYISDFVDVSGHTCIVTELAQNDLSQVQESLATKLSLRVVRSIAKQTLLALKYLHGKQVMHRDIKPQNILVTVWDHRMQTLRVKLADFGLVGNRSTHSSVAGTDGYMAPEVAYGEDYTNKADIWSLGATLEDLVMNAPDTDSFFGDDIEVDKRLAEELCDMMTQDEAATRPTAAECLQHPWFVDEEDTSMVVKRVAKDDLDEVPRPSAKQPRAERSRT